MNINNKLRVLRNGILYTTHDEALAAITANKDSLADGEVIVASYGVEGEIVKSIFVIKHKGACTLFDNETIENNIDSAISNALDSLDAVKTSTNGTNIQVEVKQTDGKIESVSITTDNTINSQDLSDAISNALDSLDVEKTSTDGTNIQVKVKQTDGKIESVSITKDDTINSQDLSDAINALDGSAIATEAQGNVYTVLTGVGETDGVIQKTGEVTLAAVAKTGEAGDVSTEDIEGTETNVAVTGENVPNQILSLATTLKTVQDNAAKYKVKKLTDEEVTALGEENVREAYKVVSYTGEETEQTAYTQVGDIIKIYKDSSLIETYIGSSYDTVAESDGQPVITKYIWELKETESELAEHITQAQYEELNAETQAKYQEIELQYFNLIYQLTDGTYSLTHIDISKFLAESEFKDGLKVENGVVKIKIDTTSESYITVSEDGLKLSGVDTSITNTIENLDATVRGNLNNDDTIATGKKVGVKVVETDGKLTNVTVVENDIASATDLTDEITARKAVDGQNGQTYTANSETTYISDATSLNNADVKLDTAIADLADVVEENELVTSASLNDLNTRIVDLENISVIDCGTY